MLQWTLGCTCFFSTRSAKHPHCASLEALIRQIGLNHQRMPFNFALSRWFPSGETSTARRLSGLHKGSCHREWRDLTWQQILLLLASITAGQKGMCVLHKVIFLFSGSKLVLKVNSCKNVDIYSLFKHACYTVLVLKPHSPAQLSDS